MCPPLEIVGVAERAPVGRAAATGRDDAPASDRAGGRDRAPGRRGVAPGARRRRNVRRAAAQTPQEGAHGAEGARLEAQEEDGAGGGRDDVRREHGEARRVGAVRVVRRVGDDAREVHESLRRDEAGDELRGRGARRRERAGVERQDRDGDEEHAPGRARAGGRGVAADADRRRGGGEGERPAQRPGRLDGGAVGRHRHDRRAYRAARAPRKARAPGGADDDARPAGLGPTTTAPRAASPRRPGAPRG